MRYSIVLSYAGAGFCGWQRQPSAPSVQECLEDALGKLLGGEVPVIGAGRTDTDVNAIGYVACFDGPEGLAADDFCYKLNAILPHSVVVSCVVPAAPDFHARFDAVRREYTYFLHRCKDPFVEAFSWQCGYPGLSFEAMNEAATALLGTHDFSCFEKVGADNKTSVCTVFEAYWAPYVPTHASICGGAAPKSPAAPGLPTSPSSGSVPSSAVHAEACNRFAPGTTPPNAPAHDGSLPHTPVIPSEAKEPNYWYFRISADRFLRNMVRAIVGTLIEVGRGKRSPDDFAGLILPVDLPGQGSPSANFEGALPPNTPRSSQATDIACNAGSVPPSAGRSEDRHEPSRRSLAGESVPGHALFLSKVEY